MYDDKKCIVFVFFTFSNIILKLHFHRVYKKSSTNAKITVYLGKRDFVDHMTHVDPTGMHSFI